ncbi:MAG TPA: DUF2200 family protein [Desulfitobacteriaceae bacterium]|nr:DUF2200 family protein [Desulfitobacteriaceae bacterium]
MNNERVYKMKISGVYPLYIQKVERKGRTKAEIDTVIQWLTGYDEQGLQSQIDRNQAIYINICFPHHFTSFLFYFLVF